MSQFLFKTYSYEIRACECGSVHIDAKDKEGVVRTSITIGPEEVGEICGLLRGCADLIALDKEKGLS